MLSAKTLKRLVILTTICAVPVVLIAFKNSTSAIKNKNALFLPSLMQKPDQISKVILQDKRHTITLQKGANGWQMVERNNYPVLKDKVEELLYSIADLRVVEPKTSNHDLYKQLDVNDLNDADSSTILITVSDAYNATLAKFFIGKREGIRVGEEYQEHIFVRKADEDQTWLVEGVMPLSNDFRDWVEQPLIGIIESEQIRSVEIDKPKGDKIVISKAKEDQEDFSLENLQAKQGMVLDLDAVNTVPFEIAELEYRDVQPVSGSVNWNNSINTTLETFAGVKIILNFVKDGDKVLAKVHADASQEVKPELLEKVLAFNNSKKDWVYEIAPEMYKELALHKTDFLKPKDQDQ